LPALAIIVMGVSGCGKSTVAQLLASELTCSFLEGDSLHSSASIAKMSAGQPLTDDDRWPWLDRIGTALNEAVATDGIAVAACSALKQVYRERLRQQITVPTVFILLDGSYDELAQRLQQRLQQCTAHFMPSSLLSSQLATLERPSANEQALVLNIKQTPPALVSASLAWLASLTAADTNTTHGASR
jgi:gluconokinase